MENDNISFGQNTDTTLIEIRVKRPLYIVNLLLTAFIIGAISIPFAILYGAIKMEFPIGPGFIVSLLIFGAFLAYFVRLYLWNRYGKEVFLIENNTVLYYNDYKYFKDNQSQTKFSEIEFGFISNSENVFKNIEALPDSTQPCRFSISLDNEEILESQIISNTEYLKKIQGKGVKN